MTFAVPTPFRLHIGGEQPKAGWTSFNIQAGEGVDIVGDIRDLTGFADGCCDEIYASHVLEHVPTPQVIPTVHGLYRILKPGGRVLISVPDLTLLCRLFLRPDLDTMGRFHVMRIMFGGQLDPHDLHQIGLSEEFLGDFLKIAGFTRIERVRNFDLFKDTSSFEIHGEPISLNMIAYK
jgi:predicted SAM-dependent methyltransferase